MSTYQAKVILVGPCGVGKTSLITAFVGGEFESGSTPTVAPAFCARSVTLSGNRTVDLQCWDTAGQERFLSISATYYRDADIALVCYSPGDVAAFQTWTKRVREVTPLCKIFAVVTKSDVFSLEELQHDEAAIAGELRTFGASRFITSALSRDGINLLVEAVALAAVPRIEANAPVTATVDVSGEGKRKGGCCPG
jgi:Ras-related protein Rab-8A